MLMTDGMMALGTNDFIMAERLFKEAADAFASAAVDSPSVNEAG